MARHLPQQTVLFRNVPQRPPVEVCPTPAKPPFMTHDASQGMRDISSFRSVLSEKLVDKPECFRWHEAQMVSNLHSGQGGRVRR